MVNAVRSTKKQFEVITVQGVDEDGFSFTQTKRVEVDPNKKSPAVKPDPNVKVDDGPPVVTEKKEQPVKEDKSPTNQSKGSQASNKSTSAQDKLPLPNALEVFTSYNYVFTLGALSVDEINNPDNTYRKNGAKVNVLQSGGGLGSSKATSAYEKNGRVEYFIDNVEVETVIAPTTRNRTTNATSISFEVHEPYSMGLFLQTLQTAAKRAQGTTASYNRIPYLLSIRFKGWDDDGNEVNSEITQKHLPLKFITVTFNVNEGGCVYSVEAVPWNEQALSDQVQSIKTDLKITGDSVVKALQTGANSLSVELNSRLLEQEEKEHISAADEYVIIFPKETYVAPGNSNNEQNSATADTSNSEEDNQILFESISGNKGGEVPADFDAFKSKLLGVVVTRSQTSDNIKRLVQSENSVNDIGKALLKSDRFDGGDTPFGLQRFTEVEDSDPKVYRSENLSISDNFKSFTFKSGTSIERIIEEMVLLSDYGKRVSTFLQENSEGEIPWFRVDTQVYMNADAENVAATGETPKIYVFRVLPFFVDASVFDPPSKPAAGVERRKSMAAKEYNYIYTGANKDIVNFDIKIDNAFFKAVAPDLGESGADTKMQTKDNAQGTKQTNVKQGEGAQGVNSESGSSQAKQANVIRTGNAGGSAGSNSVEVQIARQFHEAIVNSNADLISIELEILGDPYYIADSGMGNYSSKPHPVFSSVTEDGTVNYQQREVLCVINFRTPVDYGNDGLMEFPEDTVPVNAFSGLYKIITIQNSFSGGNFKQTLSCVRVQNQESDTGQEGTPSNQDNVVAPGTSKNTFNEDPGNSYNG